MNGFFCMLKPPGMTSSDMVVCVRRLLPKGTAVGHGGTLDPEAAGVLPIMVGKATRLFDYILDKQKEYIAEMQLGAATDTQDATGEVTSRFEGALPEEAAVKRALLRFTGDIMQTPPAYSAVKLGGKKLYELARKGEEAQAAARPARIDALMLDGSLGGGAYRMIIRCGKGTYIRTLIHDIGQALGCGAYMRFLMRTASGAFAIAHSVTLEELRGAAERGALAAMLMPMDAPLSGMARADVDESCFARCLSGNAVGARWVRVSAGAGVGEGEGDGMQGDGPGWGAFASDGAFGGMSAQLDENVCPKAARTLPADAQGSAMPLGDGDTLLADQPSQHALQAMPTPLRVYCGGRFMGIGVRNPEGGIKFTAMLYAPEPLPDSEVRP